MAERKNVRYSRLSAYDDDNYGDGAHDPRFDYTPKAFDRVPFKSILLALFLLSLGSLLLFLSYFVFTGHMEGEKSQAYGLFGLGVLTFLPVQDFTRPELRIIHGKVPKDIASLLSLITEALP